jgi:L-seryl-tRNA(Ser) seleniumtransferase
MKNPLASIPSVEQILNHLSAYHTRIDRRFIKKLIQTEIAIISTKLIKNLPQDLHREKLLRKISDAVANQIEVLLQSSMKRAINATGVILHTGLGRAPLGSIDMQLLENYATYTNLEINRKNGKRGERLDHVEMLLKMLTGCERAVVVNNNAAAVLLALNTLARGKRKEIIISRGELIEIGGSFRLPDVMKNSGAKMIEVGTTNKTHLDDYKNAITEKTTAVMIAHPSNYQILGFAAKPQISEILDVAHQNNLPVVYDLGSGALLDLRPYGFGYEPVVETVLTMGIDIVTFSGDKLLGGPQAGIITGKKALLDKISKNSLLRALRCDKITLALLNHTLRKFLNPSTLAETNMTIALLTRSIEQQEIMARQIKENVRPDIPVNLEIVDDIGRVGSGAYPLAEIPARSIELSIKNWQPTYIARFLRMQDIPLFGYIRNNRFYLNMLTVFNKDRDVIITILNNIS